MEWFKQLRLRLNQPLTHEQKMLVALGESVFILGLIHPACMAIGIAETLRQMYLSQTKRQNS